jgi:hypothetical protein
MNWISGFSPVRAMPLKRVNYYWDPDKKREITRRKIVEIDSGKEGSFRCLHKMQ